MFADRAIKIFRAGTGVEDPAPSLETRMVLSALVSAESWSRILSLGTALDVFSVMPVTLRAVVTLARSVTSAAASMPSNLVPSVCKSLESTVPPTTMLLVTVKSSTYASSNLFAVDPRSLVLLPSGIMSASTTSPQESPRPSRSTVIVLSSLASSESWTNKTSF